MTENKMEKLTPDEQSKIQALIAIQRRGFLQQIAMLQKELDDLPPVDSSEQDLLRFLKRGENAVAAPTQSKRAGGGEPATL
jgi:hypothetical protein